MRKGLATRFFEAKDEKELLEKISVIQLAQRDTHAKRATTYALSE